MSQISVKDLWMEYPGQVVLERINLEIPSGEFCAIVGPSGCGKTTFLRLLLSMEIPTRGEITIDGDLIASEPSPDRGVVFQRYSTFPHLTVLQNVIVGLEFAASPIGCRLWGARRRAAIEEARHMIDQVGLTQAVDKYPAELSGGMQQRLAIAQTVIRKPKVLMLDEAFGALDPGTRVQMQDLVRTIWRTERMTVFMVTHDIEEGFSLGTRVLAFDKVRIDPQEPGAFGATITFNLPLERKPDRQWIAAVPKGVDLVFEEP